MAEPDYGFTIPRFHEWSKEDVYDFAKNVVSYTDLNEVNEKLQEIMLSIHILNDKIDKCSRGETKTRTIYERTYNRAYLQAEGTENNRKLTAAINSEERENEWIAYRQALKELKGLSSELRLLADITVERSRNIKAQMKIM